MILGGDGHWKETLTLETNGLFGDGCYLMQSNAKSQKPNQSHTLGHDKGSNYEREGCKKVDKYAYLIFVIFSPRALFLAKFFST